MKIDLTENKGNGECIASEFPDDTLYTGTDKGTDEFKIFIKQKTLNEMDDHLMSDVLNELGGVMTGDYCINDESEKFIKIDGFIPALHTQASASRLTFTHDTWSHINTELETRFSGKKILGWYHSHPGHTVFFSNYDVFIQENFFNMEYMVAYVFDPTIKERGFFFWKENKTVKAKGFYIYETGDNIPVHNFITSYDNDVKEESLPSKELSFKDKILKYFPFVFAGLSVLILIILIYGIIQINAGKNNMKSLEMEIEILKRENEKLSEKVKEISLSKYLENFNETLTESKIKDKEDISLKDNASVKSADNKVNSGTSDTVSNKEIQDNREYVVKAGDTLERILISHNISREKLKDIMLKNSIKKSSDLKIGMVILLPKQ